MPVHFDKSKNRWVFKFNKIINGSRIRTSKSLPKTWSRAQAQEYDRIKNAELYDAAVGVTKERPSIERAVALYIEHRCPDLKDGNGIIKELGRLYEYYEGRFFDELPEIARTFTANMKVRENPLKPASIKNKLSYLRAACKYAQKFHDLGSNHALIIAMPTVKNERQFYASRADMLKVARLCKNRYARAMVRIGFYTGMRIGEILTIGNKGKMIDQGFSLFDTKNDDNRFVPMHPRLHVLCKYFPVPYKKRWMQRKVREAMDQAGFQHLHFHDLRHSSASAMINNDVDLHTIGAVLGHKDPRSTKRYTHLANASLVNAVKKMK